MFQEPGALPFTPKNIRSHFQHVFIVVRVFNPCSDNTYYRYLCSILFQLNLGTKLLCAILYVLYEPGLPKIWEWVEKMGGEGWGAFGGEEYGDSCHKCSKDPLEKVQKKRLAL